MTSVRNKNIKRFAENEIIKNNEYAGFRLTVKILKIVFWLVAACAIVACLTMMLGSLFIMLDYANYDTADGQAKYYECRGYLITMIFAVFSLVSAYFLLKFKLAILLGLVSCIDCVLIFSTFYGVSNQNEFGTGPSAEFWMMAVPAILVALLGIALAVLIFISKRRISAKYDNIVQGLYKAHTKNGEAAISPEEFEKVLDEYKGEEVFPTDKPLKKSQRRRKEKQENKK